MAYYVRGRAHEKKGDRAKAEKDFAQAKELGYEAGMGSVGTMGSPRR
jgi:hypothetical protein